MPEQILKSRVLTGRKVITSDAVTIDESNVVSVLNKALATHMCNSGEISYLYNYYKGMQPILNRVKEVRSEICNKIVENRAHEIVSFKVGYLCNEPIQYISRSSEKSSTESISLLNEYVFEKDKASCDKQLINWLYICGVAFRMIMPSTEDDSESPFEIYTLDPRNTFVVYNSDLGNKPLMGVIYTRLEDSGILYSVYTDNMYFEILDDKIVKSSPHIIGGVPIIEYQENISCMGAFEPVLPLLDAINVVASNRIDGVEQFIQALLLIKGMEIEPDEFERLKEDCGLMLPPDGDAKYLVQELNQSQTQTLVDYMYQTVLTICGMPNRNGGTSTSDTGAAVTMRDGWTAAETRAKETELEFKKSEKKFLKLAIGLIRERRGKSVLLKDIDIRFTRRNYENILEKSQVLTTMLASDYIHPLLAFQNCGMFSDPLNAYTMSMEHAKEREAEMMERLEASSQIDNDEDLNNVQNN